MLIILQRVTRIEFSIHDRYFQMRVVKETASVLTRQEREKEKENTKERRKRRKQKMGNNKKDVKDG